MPTRGSSRSQVRRSAVPAKPLGSACPRHNQTDESALDRGSFLHHALAIGAADEVEVEIVRHPRPGTRAEVDRGATVEGEQAARRQGVVPLLVPLEGRSSTLVASHWCRVQMPVQPRAGSQRSRVALPERAAAMTGARKARSARTTASNSSGQPIRARSSVIEWSGPHQRSGP